LDETCATAEGSSKSEIIDQMAGLLDDAMHDQVGPLIDLDDFR
jgi:hypothetical protein